MNKRLVDALPAKAERYDVFDAEVPGFHVRISPSGTKVYRLKYVAHGRQRALKIGEHGLPWTPELARKEAQRLRGAVVGGIDPQAERQKEAAEAAALDRRNISVAQLVECWLAEGRDAAPSKRDISWATDASALRRHIVPTLGRIPLSALTRADVERAHRQIVNGDTAVDHRTRVRGRAIVRGGPGIARRSVAALSSCLSWAIDREMTSENACARVKKVPQRKLERFLSVQEAARLFATVDNLVAEGQLAETFADIIRLLLLTGARKSEIQFLRWREVDLSRGLIFLSRDRSKTGEKSIQLNRAALAILEKRQRASDVVFPSREDTTKSVVGLSKAWQRVRKSANLEDVRLHDLRHSFASFAAANGASLIVIGKALGHSQPSTTARYAHLSADPVRDAVEKVGALLATKKGVDRD